MDLLFKIHEDVARRVVCVIVAALQVIYAYVCMYVCMYTYIHRERTILCVILHHEALDYNFVDVRNRYTRAATHRCGKTQY
jgi:hypothetical protein